MVIRIGEEDGCRVEAHTLLRHWSISLLLHHIEIPVLSPCWVHIHMCCHTCSTST